MPKVRPPHLQGRLLVLVLLGGAAGTLARWAVGLAVPPVAGLPLGTVAVNLAGAFVLGALLEHLAARGPDEGRRRALRLTLGTGFCGGYTTFSTFSLEVAEAIQKGRWDLAGLYVGASVLGGIIAFAVAAALVRSE